ncbi:MAG: hypothetical protein KUG77_18060 [Nannocystaceae bacterium]|nr:hypothetical protein [Nannocystaceae bacterium]
MMPPTLRTAILLAAALWAAPGCAHRAPKLEAPLGRVVVYRNGVAYFERRATVDGSFSIEVPRARVDDFLKSLTVIDLADQSPLSVSYRTPGRTSSGSIAMTIELPPGQREVLITYVTESPSWKPSYRLTLKKDETAVLQSLAIVDNVSSEAWEDVRVGVGTTSALSFRYDLHSVQMVERQKLESSEKLAMAPPKGGSTYSAGGTQQRVLANVAMEEFRNIPVGTTTSRDYTQVVEASASASRDSTGISLAGTTAAESKYSVEGANINSPSYGFAHRRSKDDEPREPPPPTALELLTQQLRSDPGRVRIEGYQLQDETDDPEAGLRRANTLREALISSGIEAERIEVAQGQGAVNDPTSVLQVVAIETGTEMTQAVSDQGDDAPRGSALFVAEDPLTLAVGHSAMVTLLEAPTSAERVYLFDPTSDRGSTRFAFNAVRVANPTDHTLDSGPVTVYAEGQYLGEGLSDAIPPRSHALVPYALDRMIRMRSEDETHDEIRRIVHVRRGLATTDTERIRTTTISLHNRGAEDATVYVRHTVPTGWSLREPPKSTEQYGDDVLVPVRVAAGKPAKLLLAESMPLESTLDVRTARDLVTVKRFLESGRAPATVATQLRALVDAHQNAETLYETLLTQQEKVAALRTRTRELRDQLVLLRKAKRNSLSSHIAKRMRTVSDELDAALLVVSELKNQRLEAHIALSTVVADLSVEDDKVVARQ